MAKFTEKQILELFCSELDRRLKSDEDSSRSNADPHYHLYLQARLSLLRDLISSMKFYINYEFD